MIRRVTKLATALIVVGAFVAPGSALALPTAQVTNPPLAPVDVGQVLTFDASASICDFAPCRYIWTWFFPSGITGGQMGEGPVIDFAFPAEAAGRTVAVVIKVVDNTLTHGFDSTTVRVAVNPIAPAVPPPPVVPPAQVPPPDVVPPVVVPPVDVTPPVVAPPADPPPVVVPPVVDPPVVDPPVVVPPVVDPAPVDTAPVDTAPVDTAPVDPVVTPVDPATPPVDPVVTPPKPVRLRHGGHTKRGA